MNYLFKNGRYVNEEGNIVTTDLLVQDGKIAKVAENITAENVEVIDVNGKLISTPINDIKQAGTYELKTDLTGYATGVAGLPCLG